MVRVIVTSVKLGCLVELVYPRKKLVTVSTTVSSSLRTSSTTDHNNLTYINAGSIIFKHVPDKEVNISLMLCLAVARITCSEDCRRNHLFIFQMTS